MRVFHGIYTRISGIGALGALLVILGIATLVGLRASAAHAAVAHECSLVTNTIMLDKMPYYIGYQSHVVCKDTGARVYNPDNNSYLKFEVKNPSDGKWWLYDMKFVSKDKSFGGDFAFNWYEQCFPTQPSGATFSWRASAHLLIVFSDGTWLLNVFGPTNSRSVACDPGSPWP
jgi:hypothetical protein